MTFQSYQLAQRAQDLYAAFDVVMQKYEQSDPQGDWSSIRKECTDRINGLYTDWLDLPDPDSFGWYTDELLTAIHVPEPAPYAGVAYERVKLHERPTAAVAAVITVADGAIAEARVVAGSVGARPQRLAQTEAFLLGQPGSDATAAAAGEIIQREVETIADGFESEAYKRQLARVTGRKAIAAAMEQATSEEGRRRAA